MSLPVPYLVFGYTYYAPESKKIPSMSVTVKSITSGSQIIVYSDSVGRYTCDLRNIPSCNNGDTIEVYFSHDYSSMQSFVLNLFHGFKNIDLYTDEYVFIGDLFIHYNITTGGIAPIRCWCNRWDVQDYLVVVETVLSKSSTQLLTNNTKPGAVGELNTILGKPRYYDKTWKKTNTIKLEPVKEHESNLKNMRNDTTIYINNITTNHLRSDTKLVNVKIEGYVSGAVL
jgi:hypothetical protein